MPAQLKATHKDNDEKLKLIGMVMIAIFAFIILNVTAYKD
jgi:hypothetical protein